MEASCRGMLCEEKGVERCVDFFFFFLLENKKSIISLSMLRLWDGAVISCSLWRDASKAGSC